ncbi:hypothetical protein AVEN_266805-1 [Araneus ventricosus]|uniref:Uncharacterized protein n=1 Tax=Araneus ventricosus TaxID=182803 RepID=A0A4Y2HCY2_ARAVE|nr:hypothetical protein AVEN_266805-1 [Araneus ventricosus]
MYAWSFSPGRVTQGVKAIPFHYTKLKHKGKGQSQTSSLGRPRSIANRSCTLLLYESFAYFSVVGKQTLGLGLAEDYNKWNKKQQQSKDTISMKTISISVQFEVITSTIL